MRPMMTRTATLFAFAATTALLLHACVTKTDLAEPTKPGSGRANVATGVSPPVPAQPAPLAAAQPTGAEPLFSGRSTARFAGEADVAAQAFVAMKRAPGSSGAQPGALLPPARYAGEELWVIARADVSEGEPAPSEPGSE